MAKVKFNLYIDSDNLIQVTELKNVETDEFVNDAEVSMSLFEEVPFNIDQSQLAFDSGGVGEIAEGDVIVGATGNATAVVETIIVTNDDWAGGNGEGILIIKQQYGAFQAENLNILNGQANIATIAVDSIGAVSVSGGADTGLYIAGHNLTTDNYVRIDGTVNYDSEIEIKAAEAGMITIDTTYVAEKFKGNETILVGILNGVNISLAHVGGDAEGYYDGVLPSDLLKLVYGSYYYLFITIVDGTNEHTQRLKLKAIYSPET